MGTGKNSAAGRALGLASMGAGVAGSYIGYVLQRALLGEEKSGARLKDSHARAARRVRDELQSLRGPAMKLGQMLSLQAGVLPEEALTELAALQMEAPGMHPSLVRVQIRQGLGAGPEEVFKEFAPEPFAAASLGQVHRAVTKRGERVAVKVQYPGIRQAIANDFRLLRAATKPAQLSGHVPKEAVDEMERQILAETDYRREAENVEFFKSRLAPLPFVEVPRVLPEYSSERVLTMSLMRGHHLEEYLSKRPPQRLRDRLGANLFELFYFQVLRLGALHADPHWGNYLFGDAAGVRLVDFGCVKYLRPETVKYLRSVFLYPGETDSAEFRRLLEDNYRHTGRKLQPATRKALVSFAENFYRKVYPPHAGDKGAVFDFGDKGFLEDYLREAQSLLRTKGVMSEYIFVARAEMGLYHTLHRLKARVPTSEVVRRYL